MREEFASYSFLAVTVAGLVLLCSGLLTKPPPPGPIGELKWDSGSGTYFGVDPKHDVIYILMEQTQNERDRIRAAFRKMVYDAFLGDH